MQKIFMGALLAAVLIGTGSAHAVDLQDCSKGTTKKRLACMEANIKLLNSSYQTVATELRGAVADLRVELGKVNKRIDDIKIPSVPDLNNYVHEKSKIRLRATSQAAQICLDDDTHNAGHIQGWECNDSGAQDWEVKIR